MAAVALDNLQALLRERGFASTLPALRVPALPPSATGVQALDALLGGGFARGCMTEVSSALSAGGTGVALAAVAAAAGRGEAVAYIDATDSFHPESAAQAGVELRRLLLVRCRWPREAWDAVNLVVGAGGFGLIVLDLLGTASLRQLREWQARPWLKLQRSIDHTATALLVLSPHQPSQESGLCAQVPAARLELGSGQARWRGQEGVSLVLSGLESTARLAYRRSMAPGKQPSRKEPQCTLAFDAFPREGHTEAAAS
ncbi:MAG: hypothetical protein KIT83_04785 [Bryobacterales bacterium]|nr:hypothetical protein [Bryobacterales bacterium]